MYSAIRRAADRPGTEIPLGNLQISGETQETAQMNVLDIMTGVEIWERKALKK